MAENTKNIVKCESGQFIFHRGQKVNALALIVRGSVEVSNGYCVTTFRAGEILGILDLESSGYLFDYVALEESTLCIFEYTSPEDMRVFGTAIKDYKNYIVHSACSQFGKISDIYEALDNISEELYGCIKKYSEKYRNLCESYMRKPIPIDGIDVISGFKCSMGADERTIRYLKILSGTQGSGAREFFEGDEEIALYHVYTAAHIAEKMVRSGEEKYKTYAELLPLLYGRGTGNIFTVYSKLALDVAGAGSDVSEFINDLEDIIGVMNDCRDMCDIPGIGLGYDPVRINDILSAIKTKSSVGNVITDREKEELMFKYSDAQVTEAVNSTANSLRRILEYSHIESAKADMFEKYLLVYKRLKDPYSTDNDVRKLRNKITELYYEIYGETFLRAEKEKDSDRIIEMFLNYGFMDEKLFEKNTLVELYYMKDEDEVTAQDVNVFTIRQWLHLIYTGGREPSKNEFDMDYEENFRELKKTQRFTAEEERSYFEDYEAKVRYEINNMFKINNRLTNGQITTFFPVLNGKDFINDAGKMRVSGGKVRDALMAVTDIDFSAFYREYLFEDEKNKIPRLSLNREVLPDIILMPNTGHRGSMWQEITGKRRDTPGRFIIPAFTADNLGDIMIKLVGAFRWELCRTIQGTYWNDVREKSLTAEYCDYVQFYKKNRELSDETKEKIKVQMQKCRNNTREMFVKDYEIWIKNESMGLTRLNKSSRYIMAAYCPFSKKYRDKIAEHPMFRDSLARYERERRKKVKELTNRFAAIRNSGGTVTEELEKNMDFLEKM